MVSIPIIWLASSLVDTVALARDTYPTDRYETIDRLIARLMIRVALYRTSEHDSLAELIAQDIQQRNQLRHCLPRVDKRHSQRSNECGRSSF
jgi:hypothetical protein